MKHIDLGLDGWYLRPWRLNDAESLALNANDVEVWRWMSEGFPHPYTRDVAEHWVREGHVTFGGSHWAITHNDAAVGGCGVTPGKAAFRCVAEVGWWIGRSHWRQGVGTRVAKAVVDAAFEDPSILRVRAPIHAGNEASMNVACKAGMTLEAIQRQSAMKAGTVIDRHEYVVTRDDWLRGHTMVSPR